MNKITQKFLHTRALPGVLFLGNRTGLLAEFQAKDGFLKRIEVHTNLGVHFGDAARRGASWRGP